MDIPIDLPPPITGQLIVVGIHTVAPGIGYTPGDPVTITGTGDDSGNPGIELPIITGPFGKVIDVVVPPQIIVPGRYYRSRCRSRCR